jgi:hypothetical protein
MDHPTEPLPLLGKLVPEENWFEKIVSSPFAGSSLRIDNYEPSLYMGTVQAYIQGLFGGSIDRNCTFIPITIYPLQIVVCPNGNINYTTTIQYVDNRGNTQNIRRTYNVSPQFKLLSIDSAFWGGIIPYNPSEALHIVNKALTPLGWFAWFGAHV